MSKNRGIAESKKNLRRQEALQRQRDYDSLTTQQKLDMLDQRGYRAKRQRARLERELEGEDRDVKKDR